MLEFGFMVHVKALNRICRVICVDGDMVFLEEELTRVYPNQVTLEEFEVTDYLKIHPGAIQVGTAVKMIPRPDGSLQPTTLSTYREGVGEESLLKSWALDLRIGVVYQDENSTESGPHANGRQTVALLSMLRQLGTRQLKQMGALYQFTTDGIMLTHTGGYHYSGGSIEDYLIKCAEPACSRQQTRTKLKLNRVRG